MVLSYTPSSSSTTKPLSRDEATMRSSGSMWYGSMLILALLAGSMDWKMQRHLQSMASSVRMALRLATIDVIENMERYHMEYEAKKEEKEAKEYKESAQILEERAEIQQVYAQRNRLRGHYMEQMAEMEHQKAGSMLDKFHRTKELRQQVLANLTLDQEEERKTLERIQHIHQGACSWRGISSICDALGGITGLQEHADQEALQIQAEWQEASGLERQEKLQSMIAQMLEGKAEKYNETATDLLRVADIWEKRAQEELEAAEALNLTALELEHDAQVKEEEATQVVSDVAEIELEAHKYLHAAQMDHVAAYWYSIVAIVAGFCSLVFFVGIAAPRLLVALEQSVVETDPARPDTTILCSNLSYCVTHVLLFLVVVGMTGDYFYQMQHYDVAQRANIVVWFAFLGGVFQTFLLHAVPRFLEESRASTPDLEGYIFHLITKFLMLFAIFAIEVLLVWLTLGKTLFLPSVVNVLNTLVLILLPVVTALLHAFLFDGQQAHNYYESESVTVWRYDDQSTVVCKSGVLSQSSQIVSECTPLRKDEILSVRTIVDMHVADNASRSSMTGENSTMGRHRYIAALQKDLYQVVLPFEVLVIASMVAVLRNCLLTVWNSQSTALQCAVLVCASVLLIMGALLVRDLTCCDDCYDESPSDRRRRKRFAKVVGKRPDALELVQV
ncbi:hypothetical protein ACA910_010213 [Epithemia clementina (nom. ined.)]